MYCSFSKNESSYWSFCLPGMKERMKGRKKGRKKEQTNKNKKMKGGIRWEVKQRNKGMRKGRKKERNDGERNE